MILIREVAGRLNPAPVGRRMMGMIWFYCDESHDSKTKHPDTYAVCGLVGEEAAWNRLERQWAAKNTRAGVRRFHSAEINARDGEFSGWGDTQVNNYVKSMLRVISKRKEDLIAVGCAIHADAYRKIISKESREKYGLPYIVCFKMCVMLIAERLAEAHAETKISVIFERNEHVGEIVEVFECLKATKGWKQSGRLGLCAPGGWEEFSALQAADAIAYDTFKMLLARRSGSATIRKSLKSLYKTNTFLGFYLDAEGLTKLKPFIENTPCSGNQFIPDFSQFRRE